MAERVQRLDLVGRKPTVADHLERADTVRVALAHLQHERRLAGGVVDEDRVPRHLEVGKPSAPVECGQLLLLVRPQLFVVVRAVPPPPEPFGLGAHVGDDLRSLEVCVPLDVDPGDRHPAAFVDVEHQPHAARVSFEYAQRPHARQVVAAGAVQRVDAPARALHRGGVEGPPLGELHPVADRVLAQPVDAPDRPLDEGRALLHADHEERDRRRGVLLDADVVELAGGVERLDGVAEVAVAHLAARHQAAGEEHAGSPDTLGAHHGDRIRHAGAPRHAPALRGAGARSETDGGEGETEEEPAAHAFVPVRARKARRSLSGATSTSISSPLANSPTRIFSDSGSSTYFWIARFSGRAP